MKITSTHYNQLVEATSGLSSAQIEQQRQFIIAEGKAKDVEKRLRWDIAYYFMSNEWFNEIYEYAHDNHIDTALRKLMTTKENS